jgi:exopolysaccharide biosynthesis polyprenyl glycosylphosphotransferase
MVIGSETARAASTAPLARVGEQPGAPGRDRPGVPRPRSAAAATLSGGPAHVLRQYRTRAVLLDLLAGGIAAEGAILLRFGVEPSPTYLTAALLAPVLWVFAVAVRRGYELRFLGAGPDEYRNLADAALVLFTLIAIWSFSLKGDLSRAVIIGFLPLAFVLSLVARRRLRSWLYGRRLSGQGMHRVLVVGQAEAVAHLAQQFDREPWHGLATVGVCVNGPALPASWPSEVPVAAGTDPRSVLRAVDAMRADVVAVASHPDLSGHALRRLAWALDERDVDLVVSPGIVEVAGPRLSIRPVAGLSLLHLERPSTRSGRMLVKGVLDRLLGTVLVVLLAPLFAAVAVAIKRTSPGPVLFRQIRIGADGRPFEMLKFRSMVVDAEDLRADLEAENDGNGVLFKIRDDPRVTRVGAWLRRYSLDELPQLWNVVRGDMSLVGPRPPLPEEVIEYSDDATRRLRVRPGMTGLWQVSGRSDLSWEESLRLDLRYVDNWSLALDAVILWRTGRAVLSRHGAY